MKFNNLKKISPQHLQKIYILTVILTAPLLSWLLLVIVTPFLSSKLKNLKTSEIISIFAIIITIMGISIKIIFDLIDRQVASKRQIKLCIEVKGKVAIITCLVENLGQKRITPQNVYLFIDEGIENDGVYDFPYLLKHEEGEYDCNLSKKCKMGIGSYPIDLVQEDYKNLFHRMIKLNHISKESILYIDPGETFSEDIALKLKENKIYRAMVIWTAVKEDCICTTKKFSTGDFR